MAALTFSAEKWTVFRDCRGSAVLLCPVRKRCHERKVMSVPPGCLLNLRHHYFTTQHDCIHIIPIPPRSPLTWRPCARGLVGLGLSRERQRPFSVDGQSNKARSSMTHQSARVSFGGEHCHRRRGENSRCRPPSQQRLTYAPTPGSHNVELQH